MGEHPTAMKIVEPPNESIAGFGTGFGTIYMMDDPLTEGPSPSSKLVGRSRGIYAKASQHDLGLLMALLQKDDLTSSNLHQLLTDVVNITVTFLKFT